MINIEKPESIGYQSSIEKGFDVLKHGIHDQSSHGRRGGGGSGSRNIQAVAAKLNNDGFSTSPGEDKYTLHVIEGNSRIGTFAENKDNSFAVESVSSRRLYDWVLSNGGNSRGPASEGGMYLPPLKGKRRKRLEQVALEN